MYKLIFKLAYNNAFSRLSRTLLVVIMIAVSMSMMISIQGLYNGMTVSMIDKTKRSDSGEISIYANGYRLSKNIKDTIPNASTIINQLSIIPTIDAISKRVKAEGLSATARKSAFSTIIGIDLKSEEKFGEFSKFLKDGKLQLDSKGTLITSELAKTLKVKIGSKIIFSTQDSTGEINSMALRVRGIIQTNNISLDSSTIYVDITKLQKFLMLDSQNATQIAIRTQSKELRVQLAQRYPNLEVKSFLELYPMLKQMKDMMVIFNSITFFIVMLVVFIGIMGVMYVSILDRIREFGIMISIGLSYQLIRLQILFEALIISLFGYILGSILGYLSLSYLLHIGVDLSHFSDGLNKFGMDTILYADIRLSYFTSVLWAIISASILSIILPLKKIKNMNLVESVKVDT